MRYRVSARRSYLDLLVKEAPYHLTDLQGIVEGWTPGGDRLTLTAYKGRDVFDLTSLDDEDFPLRVDWDWGNDAFGVRWTHPRRGVARSTSEQTSAASRLASPSPTSPTLG